MDPTLLLESEEWNKICEPTKLDGKEYILIYQLHHNKEMENYIKNLKNTLNCLYIEFIHHYIMD